MFDGAKGRVNDVTVTGGDYGVEIENTVGSSVTFATTDQVKVDNRSSISGYQPRRRARARTTCGSPSSGPRSATRAPRAVTVPPASSIEGLAHGAVDENHISLSDAEACLASFGAGVRAGVDDLRSRSGSR